MSVNRAWTPRVALGIALAALLAVAVPAAASAASPRARITAIGAAPSSQPIQLVLPLVADDAGIERFAAAVSDPASRRYAQYEPLAALARRFGAPARTRRQVVAYLRGVGASSVKIDRTGLFADAVLGAAKAERLFATPLTQFRSATGERFLSPRQTATVPAGLRGLVLGVVGLDTRRLGATGQLARSDGSSGRIASQPSSALPRTGTPSSNACAGGKSAGEVDHDSATAGFTPNQYLTAYGYAGLYSTGLRGQGERVALIEIDGFKPSDIRSFASCFHLDIPRLNGFTIGLGNRRLAPGGEATLDLEVLDAAAPNLKAIDIYETRADAANTLLALTAPLQNPGYRPQVISASLGLCEQALRGAIGRGGIDNTEAALAMAAASGTTFLASSGDQGSADCVNSSGRSLHELAVNFPASSPWVTGVGGTNFLLNAANQITSEVVWNDAQVQPGSAGGGGPSQLFPRPYYQNGTVHHNHRGVPDVSMLADIVPGYAIYCTASIDCSHERPWEAVGGTSAATPLLAGGVALVDQELREHHRQDLGLANPLLYRLGRSSLSTQVFTDVLFYGNDVGTEIPGNGHPLGCCSAAHGFDLASGWGSVNVDGLGAQAVALQPPRESMTLPAHQKPVANHQIDATVSCMAACRMGAVAEVKITGQKAFQAASEPVTLAAAGKQTVSIAFSSSQLSRLRRGLQRHRRIVAEVSAVILDSQNRIQSATLAKRLTIKS